MKEDCTTSSKDDVVPVLQNTIVWMLTLVLRLIRVAFQLVQQAMHFLECGAVIVRNYTALKLSTVAKYLRKFPRLLHCQKALILQIPRLLSLTGCPRSTSWDGPTSPKAR